MVKLCKHNKYTSEVSAFLSENAIEHIVENCLDRCDLCHTGAFIKQGDIFISGNNGEELIDNIKALF